MRAERSSVAAAANTPLAPLKSPNVEYFNIGNDRNHSSYGKVGSPDDPHPQHPIQLQKSSRFVPSDAERLTLAILGFMAG